MRAFTNEFYIGLLSTLASLRSVLRTFWRGSRIIVEKGLLVMARNYSTVIQAYYLMYGATLIHLHYVAPQDQSLIAGHDVINDTVGLHWSVAPTVFLIGSLIVPKLERYWHLTLSVVPVFLYSGVLAFASFTGATDSRAWLSVVSNISFFLAMINVISLSFYLGKRTESEHLLRIKVAELTAAIDIQLKTIRLQVKQHGEHGKEPNVD